MVISQREKRDILVFHVKNLTNAFYSIDRKVQNFLHKNYHVLRHEVKKQLPHDGFSRINLDNAES